MSFDRIESRTEALRLGAYILAVGCWGVAPLQAYVAIGFSGVPPQVSARLEVLALLILGVPLITAWRAPRASLIGFVVCAAACLATFSSLGNLAAGNVLSLMMVVIVAPTLLLAVNAWLAGRDRPDDAGPEFMSRQRRE